MDPLCHTLVGAGLAGTRLGERSWGARFTLLAAANLPDVDVLAYAWGSDAALGFRRGWTHGVPALLAWPLLLAGAVTLCGRRRGEVRPRSLVALAFLGVLTHSFLDWLNTYGMRWWMPFDGAWSYGDTLFIVDPWLWLLLGGAAFLRFSASRRAVAAWAALAAVASWPLLASELAPPAAQAVWLVALGSFAMLRATGVASTPARGRRWCAAGLAAAVAYVAASLFATAWAERAVATAAARAGETPRDVFAGPIAADPTRRDVLLVGEDGYRAGVYRFGGSVDLGERLLSAPQGDDRVAAALAAPCARGTRTWLRYPLVVLEDRAAGTTVHLLDARYARTVRPGFGVRSVRLDAGRVAGCD